MSSQFISAFAQVHVPNQPSRLCYVLYSVSEHEIQPYTPLLQFFVEREGMRISAQKNTVRAVRLLLTYLQARGVSSLHEVPRKLLGEFVTTQLQGTVHLPAPQRLGLFWLPRSRSCVAADLGRIDAFTDWLSNRLGESPLNLWREATSTERLVALRRAEHRSLSSLIDTGQSRRSATAAHWARSVTVPRANRGIVAPVKAFDWMKFVELLADGFRRGCRRRETDGQWLRNVMIVLLLGGTGLRISEPFHLFVEDVSPDPDAPGCAQVRLYHPSLGAAPRFGQQRWPDRQAYLARYNLEPRHLVAGRFHAGWKNLALTDSRENYALLSWRSPLYAQLFLSLYRRYIALRPRCGHPFLFISERTEQYGEPYTVGAFRQTFKFAIENVGLVYGKNVGTSPHGLRHAFCSALKQAGVSPEIIRGVMRHKSLESQQVYGQPNVASIAEVLRVASGLIEESLPESLGSLLP